MSDWYLNIVCCRVSMDVWDQDAKAAFDAATAASISAWVDFGTRVITSFVAWTTEEGKMKNIRTEKQKMMKLESDKKARRAQNIVSQFAAKL